MSSSCIVNVSAEAMSDLTKSARHEYVKLGSGTYHVTSKLRKSTACIWRRRATQKRQTDSSKREIRGCVDYQRRRWKVWWAVTNSKFNAVAGGFQCVQRRVREVVFTLLCCCVLCATLKNTKTQISINPQYISSILSYRPKLWVRTFHLVHTAVLYL